MGIASTGYLPKGNDVTKGGEVRKVNLTRCGGMRPAKKDTYKRVYKNDGTYHYPKKAANQLRKKGELYFEPMEVTGSSEGTEQKPKFSLLKWFIEVEIPRLEEIAREYETLNMKKLIIRYQMDSAGPHVDGTLINFLRDAFHERGWILKHQPSNSPLTNVKDACIFPAMSKAVTEEQGLSNESYVLEGEQLWQIVTKCWESLLVETIGCSYVAHHQIVNAIAKCKGGDDFVRSRGGLHCGVRKVCIPYYENDESTDPVGVEVIATVDPDDDVATAAAELKYSKPDVPELQMSKELSPQELNVLFENLPEDSPSWEKVATAIIEQNVPEAAEDNADGSDGDGEDADDDDAG
jgi:hypothetical protein